MTADLAGPAPPNETKTASSRFTREGRRITYQLHIIQQPEQARACGSGAKASADRRPVDPPPIVELRIFEGPDAALTDITSTFNATFFLFATLEQAREIAPARGSSDRSLTVLTGTPVSGLVYLDRPSQAGYFLFSDLSVRHEGLYRLAFNLYEELKHERDADAGTSSTATGSHPNVTHRLEVKSQPFSVFSAKKFPGLKESTDLSKTVADQGCRVRIRKDVRIKRRVEKPISDDAEIYKPPGPEYTARDTERGAEVKPKRATSPHQGGISAECPSHHQYHHQPAPTHAHQQSFHPGPQTAQHNYQSPAQVHYHTAAHASSPTNAYPQQPFHVYQDYAQPGPMQYPPQQVPPPDQYQPQPQQQQPRPISHPSQQPTYQAYPPSQPVQCQQPVHTSQMTAVSAAYDPQYAMSTSSSASGSRSHAAVEHATISQQDLHLPRRYSQPHAHAYADTIPPPTVTAIQHYPPAQYMLQTDRGSYVAYSSTQSGPSSQFKSLPALNTAQMVPNHHIEASSPASAGPSPIHDNAPRNPRFSADSGIGNATAAGGKRTYSQVFDTQHINRPFHAGQRPEMGVSAAANSALVSFDHDTADTTDDSALNALRMEYKRADGRYITKAMHGTT